MVCDKCQKKLDAVICPDVWKDGAKNTIESGGRKVNENKLLHKNKKKFVPYEKGGIYGTRCKICKQPVHQKGHYCQACAYKKGICAMCGVKILDTTGYKQTSK